MKFLNQTIMRKFIALIVLLQLGIILGAKENSSKEGINILAIKEVTVNGSEFRSQSISADITGHTLTITFNENVGIAHIVIKDSNGVYIDRENVFSTPDYATFFINDDKRDVRAHTLVVNYCQLTYVSNNE